MRELIDKIERRSARCGVIGLGYVGLPLALEFARAGFHVTGIDLDERKVESILAGRSYIVDVQDEEIGEPVRAGRFVPTTDFSVIRDLDTINICVPTPLRKTKDPDLTYVVSAVSEIKRYLRPGQLVILESTTYPGTTEEVVRPALEASGLKVGIDFALAFSPERIDPGNAQYNTRNIPKVVGGVTATCTQVAKRLYEASVDTVVPVSSTEVAEMVKLLENTFRSVNIGLVNEIALMCCSLKINVWEVIDAAKTKPFGYMAFYPGPGLGGHCIPIDPFYLSWKAKMSGFDARFIELAGAINESMPRFVVERITDALNRTPQKRAGSAYPCARGGLQGGSERHPGVAGPDRDEDTGRQGGDPVVLRSLRADGARGRLRFRGRPRRRTGARGVRLRGRPDGAFGNRLRVGGPSRPFGRGYSQCLAGLPVPECDSTVTKGVLSRKYPLFDGTIFALGPVRGQGLIGYPGRRRNVRWEFGAGYSGGYSCSLPPCRRLRQQRRFGVISMRTSSSASGTSA